MELPPWALLVVGQLMTFGLKLLGAIAVWIIATDPAPQVEILQFTPAGPLLAVRPSCRNEHYWQVYFDTNRAIREAFAGAGYPAPEQLVLVRSGT